MDHEPQRTPQPGDPPALEYAPPARPRGVLRPMLRALSSRNYRLFFGGQLISLTGTWMTRIATGWLVYRLTESPLLLGIVGFSGQIPTFLGAPFMGVLADRWNRHRLLVMTQAAAMCQSLALAALALSGVIRVWHIIVLSVLQGLINAMDIPVRQAFVVEMVEDREHLGNAVALNSMMVNGARLVGPAVGGVLIAAVGEGMCFLVDGLSYVAVIAALLAMRVAPRRASERQNHVLHDLREGLVYAFGFKPIRSVLLLMAAISFAGVPYMTLLPVFAKEILGGGPNLLGFLMAVSGIGAVSAGIYLASRRSVLGLGRVIFLAAGTFGASIAVFALSRHVVLSAAMMLLAGAGMLLQMASSNTVLQTIVEDKMRGRVMSFYTMAFMGTVPFGTLVIGALARTVGVSVTVAAGGMICVGAALWFARRLPSLREMVRPIYVQRGILPEVASGMQLASDMTGRARSGAS